MITEPDLIEAVRAQARAHPDRVYEADLRPDKVSCNYTRNSRNDCGCIVGEALRALGVPLELLKRLDYRRLGSWDARVDEFRAVLGGHVTDGALRSVWVADVQLFQDEGKSWARAVEWADDARTQAASATDPANGPLG